MAANVARSARSQDAPAPSHASVTANAMRPTGSMTVGVNAMPIRSSRYAAVTRTAAEPTIAAATASGPENGEGVRRMLLL